MVMFCCVLPIVLLAFSVVLSADPLTKSLLDSEHVVIAAEHKISSPTQTQYIWPTDAQTLFRNPDSAVLPRIFQPLVLYKDTHEVMMGFDLGLIYGVLAVVELHLQCLWAELTAKIEGSLQKPRVRTVVARMARHDCLDTSVEHSWESSRSIADVLGTYSVVSGQTIAIDLTSLVAPNLAASLSRARYYEHNRFNSTGLEFDHQSLAAPLHVCVILSTEQYAFLKFETFSLDAQKRPHLIVKYNRMDMLIPLLTPSLPKNSLILPYRPDGETSLYDSVCCPTQRHCRSAASIVALSALFADALVATLPTLCTVPLTRQESWLTLVYPPQLIYCARLLLPLNNLLHFEEHSDFTTILRLHVLLEKEDQTEHEAVNQRGTVSDYIQSWRQSTDGENNSLGLFNTVVQWVLEWWISFRQILFASTTVKQPSPTVRQHQRLHIELRWQNNSQVDNIKVFASTADVAFPELSFASGNSQYIFAINTRLDLRLLGLPFHSVEALKSAMVSCGEGENEPLCLPVGLRVALQMDTSDDKPDTSTHRISLATGAHAIHGYRPALLLTSELDKDSTDMTGAVLLNASMQRKALVVLSNLTNANVSDYLLSDVDSVQRVSDALTRSPWRAVNSISNSGRLSSAGDPQRVSLSDFAWRLSQMRCPDVDPSGGLWSGQTETIPKNWTSITGAGNFSGCLPASVWPIEAVVPGYVHLDLVRAGIISEPLSSDNEARAGWVAWSDWHLETKVMWPRENNSDSFTSVGLYAILQSLGRVQLEADGIDTLFRMRINGRLMLQHERLWNGSCFIENNVEETVIETEDVDSDSVFSGNNMYRRWTFELDLERLHNESLLNSECPTTHFCFTLVIELYSSLRHGLKLAKQGTATANTTDSTASSLWHQQLQHGPHPDWNASSINSTYNIASEPSEWQRNLYLHWNQIRKSPAHHGWDWGPAAAPMGIWQPITLLVFPLMRLHSVRLQPVFHYDSLDVRPDECLFDASPASGNVTVHADVFLDLPRRRLRDKLFDMHCADLTLREYKAVMFVNFSLSLRIIDDATFNVQHIDQLSLCDLLDPRSPSPDRAILGRRLEFDYWTGALLVHLKMTLPLQRIRLWWPRHYGRPHLYTAFVQLNTQLVQPWFVNANQVQLVHDSISRTLGFRHVEVQTSGGKFVVRMNRCTLWLRGVNWIPPSIFYVPTDPVFTRGMFQNPGHSDSVPPRSAFDTLHAPRPLRDSFDSMVAAQINLVRVWGGGVYESDAFYELADKMGIMVWQDFMFACALYPTRPAFLHTVAHEVASQVRRLHSHPALILWCGNNEVEWNLKLRDYGPLRGASEGAYQSWERDYERLFVHTVRRVVGLENPQQAGLYLGSSPTNGPLVTDAAHFQDIVDPDTMDDNTMSWGYPNDEWRGTVHAWEVWFDIRKSYHFFELQHPRFVSEFGFQSLPTSDRILAESLLTPEQMTYFPADVDLRDMKDREMNNQKHIKVYQLVQRQRSPRGMLNIISRIHEMFPMAESVSRLAYQSLILQALILSTALQHFRRLTPRCSGAIVWQLNDIWTAPTWSLMQYDGSWKPSLFVVRAAFSSHHLLTARVVFVASMETEHGRVHGAAESADSEQFAMRRAELQLWLTETPHRPESGSARARLIRFVDSTTVLEWRWLFSSRDSSATPSRMLFSADIYSLMQDTTCTIHSCFILFQSLGQHYNDCDDDGDCNIYLPDNVLILAPTFHFLHAPTQPLVILVQLVSVHIRKHWSFSWQVTLKAQSENSALLYTVFSIGSNSKMANLYRVHFVDNMLLITSNEPTVVVLHITPLSPCVCVNISTCMDTVDIDVDDVALESTPAPYRQIDYNVGDITVSAAETSKLCFLRKSVARVLLWQALRAECLWRKVEIRFVDF